MVIRVAVATYRWLDSIEVIHMIVTRLELEQRWKVEVYELGDTVDDAGEHDWHSLAYGFALGAGMPIEEAQNFAHYIRYSTNMG